MTEFMQPLFQETTDPGNSACAPDGQLYFEHLRQAKTV